jgi:hypothetical protein
MSGQQCPMVASHHKIDGDCPICGWNDKQANALLDELRPSLVMAQQRAAQVIKDAERARLREGAEEKVRNLLFEHVDRTVADISRFELSRLIVSALFGEGGK